MGTGRPAYMKNITPDDVLELLEDYGMIVDGKSAFNEETMRPYTKYDMSKKLAKHFGYKSGSPRHVYMLVNEAMEEFNLGIPSTAENSSYIQMIKGREQDKLTELVFQHTGVQIDLDKLNVNHKIFMRWRCNWRAMRRRVLAGKLTEHEAVLLFLDYYYRKLKDPEVDGRHGKPNSRQEVLKRLEDVGTSVRSGQRSDASQQDHA